MSAPRGFVRASRSVALGAILWSCALAGARAEMLHATYSVSLLGLPIGVANLDASLTPSSYSIDAHAKITGLAYLFSRARGASTGAGAIVGDRIVPATFATIATNANMTRTIRMSLVANAVTGVDITPPFDDKPDRVPLTEATSAASSIRSAPSCCRCPPGSAGRPRLLRSQDSGVRRLHAVRRRRSPTSASARFRPRATAARWRSARSATCRSPAIAATVRDQVHGRQQGPRSVAGAGRQFAHVCCRSASPRGR